VRVIAATNQDLWRIVEERKFRADLYFRLNFFPIMLPPLRELKDDIPFFYGVLCSQIRQAARQDDRLHSGRSDGGIDAP
jgi:transcriptional regulator with GAF, ATPase, and Fis domain